MDRITADDLRPYEPLLRSLRAPFTLQAGLGYDHDDVRNECRLRAAQALTKWRATGEQGTEEEQRYTRAAIRRRFIDLLRRAKSMKRTADDAAWGSVLADGQNPMFDLPGSGTPGPDRAFEASQHADLVALTIEVLGRRLDRADYALLRGQIDGTPTRLPGQPREQAYKRLHRAKLRARKVLGSNTFGSCERRMHAGEINSMAKTSDLDTDTLARVALVHNIVPPAGYDREALIGAIDQLNGDVPFPECFAEEFDAKDADCTSRCGFSKECAANIPKHALGGIEKRLVELRGTGEDAPVPVAEPTAPTPPPEPAAPAPPEPELQPAPPAVTAEDVEVEILEDGTFRQKTKAPEPVDAEIVPPAPKKAPPKKAKAKAKKAPPKKAPPPEPVDAEPQRAPEPAPPPSEPEKPVKTTAKKKAAKKAKPAPKPKAAKKAKAKAKAAAAPAAERTDPRYAPLSARRGVPRKDLGKRAIQHKSFRLPQGSAVAAAYLPVGARIEREYEGRLYVVEKIVDGAETKGRDNKKRKRDGTWVCQAVHRGLTTDDAQYKKHAALGAEGTLGTLAKVITGAANWSGARFFGLTQAAVAAALKDLGEDSLARQLARKPSAMYVYGEDEQGAE